MAWVAAIAAWLACVVIYIRQYLHEFHLAAAKAAPPDHVAPATFLAAAVVFGIILTRSSLDGGARLTRATFFCLALMLGVFAVWALSGSATLPRRSPPR